jgi:hypothetical protein
MYPDETGSEDEGDFNTTFDRSSTAMEAVATKFSASAKNSVIIDFFTVSIFSLFRGITFLKFA